MGCVCANEPGRTNRQEVDLSKLSNPSASEVPKQTPSAVSVPVLVPVPTSAPAPPPPNEGKIETKTVIEEETKNEPDPENTFRINVQWTYVAQGKTVVVQVGDLIFLKDQCTFTQHSEDSYGPFTVSGQFDIGGNTKIEVKYTKPQHNLTFKGTLQEKTLAGTWTNATGETGNFKLEFVLKGWKGGDHFVALQNETELVGLGHIYNKWCVISGVHTDNEAALVNLSFADESAGTFEGKITEDQIIGKLNLPTGEDYIFITESNDFA